MLLPGQQAVAHFNVVRRGELATADNVEARVYRNDVLEPTTVTAVERIVGHYTASFVVPDDWAPGDVVTVTFLIGFGGGRSGARLQQAMSTKRVGIVGSKAYLLLDADQVRDGNEIRYYRKGTNQTELLGVQVQSGDPCSDQTSLVWQ